MKLTDLSLANFFILDFGFPPKTKKKLKNDIIMSGFITVTLLMSGTLLLYVALWLLAKYLQSYNPYNDVMD